ncbi:hypothetical protein MYX07_04855 [Patescibacteria group bacterium AH-259-L07]|nr:hypothetical protein [Patescibacteria group bacterium AH-259-L07]
MATDQQLKGGLALRRKWQLTKDMVLKEADEEFEAFKDNPRFTFGLGLYLAEGTKTSMTSMVNLDYRVLKIFIEWCKEYLNGKNFSARLRIAPDVDEDEAKTWWENKSGIKPTWTKTQFKSVTGKSGIEYSNKYGLCRVTLLDSLYTLEKIMRWIDLYSSGPSWQ